MFVEHPSMAFCTVWINSQRVVQIGRSIQAETDLDVILPKKPAKVPIEKQTVGLDKLLKGQTGVQFGDHSSRLAKKFKVG